MQNQGSPIKSEVLISEQSEERDNSFGSFLNKVKKETTRLAHFLNRLISSSFFRIFVSRSLISSLRDFRPFPEIFLLLTR